MALFLKVLCDIAKHRKFIEAGPVAGWLWLAGVGHCRLSSTDGFIHREVVPGLVPGLKGVSKAVEALVRTGLWHQVDGGYEVHDYLAMNPSKQEIAEIQQAATERKRDYRGRRSQRDVPHLSQWDTSHGDNETPHVRAGRAGGPASSHSPSDSDSGSASSPEESPRETTPRVTVEPAWSSPHRGRTESLTGHEAYHRKNCPPWGWAACQAGLCIPKYLWPQWEQRHGRDTAKLQAFVEAVVADTPRGSGDKAEAFWPAHFELAFGATVATAPAGRQTAAQRTIATMRMGDL